MKSYFRAGLAALLSMTTASTFAGPLPGNFAAVSPTAKRYHVTLVSVPDEKCVNSPYATGFALVDDDDNAVQKPFVVPKESVFTLTDVSWNAFPQNGLDFSDDYTVQYFVDGISPGHGAFATNPRVESAATRVTAKSASGQSSLTTGATYPAGTTFCGRALLIEANGGGSTYTRLDVIQGYVSAIIE